MDIRRTGTTAIAVMLALGVVALMTGVGIDGFFGGMLQGAGLALVLLGVYGLGMRHRSDRSASRGEEPEAWLPSRDDQR
ncbi:hypothetical protein ASG73_02315 [Janibacter sp. Soil728]|uniref:hypothetical protein n=1 Tax=Janibacter sp. Soil728 TaxID=1736393 RepID=UPI000701A435|nr:hypothetical protein [Janibacter sp. Soil728]KRE39196.1 hypothetical protein ASG73_02315 [Janibacter sp. Soil728]